MNSSNKSSTEAWQRGSLVALALSITVTACGTQGPEQKEGAPSAPAAAKQQLGTSSARTRLNPAALRAPRVAQAVIRSGTASYEVEVQSPQGFSPRGFDPVLRIGDKEFSSYRESSVVGEYGAVFRVERATFEALADNSVVSIGYDRASLRSAKFGNLDKRALVIR